MTRDEQFDVIAENVPKVYEAGYSKGYENGKAEGGSGAYDEGFEAGKKAEHDAFWDTYQDNGNRTNYGYAFAGAVGWNDVTFKPKYTIKAEGAAWTALYYSFYQARISDIKAILEERGLTIDTKNARGLSASFEGCTTKNIPTLDVTNCTEFSRSFFGASKLEGVVLENLSDAATFTNTFTNCSSLVNLSVSGIIGKNGLNLQWSPKLSRDSIVSVVNALSPTTTGLTVTLSKTAVEAFDSEITAIPFGLTTDQDGANVTGVDNGDGTATFNGTIGYDTVFVHGNATDVFSAGSYAISFHDANQFDFYVSLFDLDGNHIITYTAWNDAHDGVVTFTVDKDFVMKASLYAMGPYTFNNEVITYPTIRPDFETLKATKPNWTISLV
jgi:hypothetical protein